jgi:hypothetical protein
MKMAKAIDPQTQYDKLRVYFNDVSSMVFPCETEELTKRLWHVTAKCILQCPIILKTFTIASGNPHDYIWAHGNLPEVMQCRSGDTIYLSYKLTVRRIK